MAIQDAKRDYRNPGANFPATNLVAITKSDSTTYSPVLRGVYVGGAGDVAIIAAEDSAAVTFTGVPAGTILPVFALKVMSTGTTATNLVGLY
jgi:hypothetical protein